MARRTPTPCRTRGCGAVVSDGTGYCPAHKGDSWALQRAGKTRKQRGYGRAWEKNRAQAMQRDRGLCVLCLAEGRVEPATDVDHIKARAHGGTDEPSNLQCLCKSHHRSKTGSERLYSGSSGSQKPPKSAG